jgi:zinc transporter, ZIP family
MNFLEGFSPMIQALMATGFTWFVTALGAGLVFFFKTINRKVLDSMLGFAAGVMIAASFWSLLAPAIEMSEQAGDLPWLAPLIGFLMGGVFLKLADTLLPHVHIGMPVEKAEGVKTNWKRSILLVTAITLHNIPEGLAVGVAFGAVAAGIPSATLAGAVALAIGIGIQNFPEGAAVSIPLRREGISRLKSFWYGQLSGVVEPVAGVIGAVAVLAMRPLLPYALSFAAGAMIYVVVEELIPEAQSSGNSDFATMGTMLGFGVMMLLDVALG